MNLKGLPSYARLLLVIQVDGLQEHVKKSGFSKTILQIVSSHLLRLCVEIVELEKALLGPNSQYGFKGLQYGNIMIHEGTRQATLIEDTSCNVTFYESVRGSLKQTILSKNLEMEPTSIGHS